MAEQLKLFGNSEHENHFNSEIWGFLTFHPSGEIDRKCLKCLLYRNQEECGEAKCYSYERQDKRNGYFTINDFPRKEN